MKSETARCFNAIVPEAQVDVECALSISADVDMKSASSSAFEVAADGLPRKELQLSAAALFVLPQLNTIVMGPISRGGSCVPSRTEWKRSRVVLGRRPFVALCR